MSYVQKQVNTEGQILTFNRMTVPLQIKPRDKLHTI